MKKRTAFKKHTLAIILTFFLIHLSFASPVFRVTADQSSISLSKTGRVVINFIVQNLSGRAQTITNIFNTGYDQSLLKQTFTSNHCLTTLVNKATCSLTSEVRAKGSSGTTHFDLNVCAMSGSLCSGLKKSIDVAVGLDLPISLSGGSFNIHSDLTIVNSNQTTLTVTNQSNLIARNIRAKLPESWGDVAQDASRCARLAPHQQCAINISAGNQSHTNAGFLIQGDNTTQAVVTGSIIRGGRLKCWGLNNRGQLGSTTGSGTADPNPLPLYVQTLGSGSRVVQVTSGAEHACALFDSGAVKCWGFNFYGQLGDPTNIGNFDANNVPLDVRTLNAGSGVVQISGGYYFNCALFSSGKVKCWGLNTFGQLGSTTNSGTNNPNITPLKVQTLGSGSGVVQISNGNNHACALFSSGAVKCWGRNNYGQLGSQTHSGTNMPNNVPLPVQTLGAGSGVVQISAGEFNTCALLNTGAVKCWGLNGYGELGSTTNSGVFTANNVPLDVQSLGAGSGVVQVVAQMHHTCALVNTGAVKCWGLNFYGQLGATDNIGFNTPNNFPLDVQTLGVGSDVVQIAGGDSFTCALLKNERVKCWGRNNFGQLGSQTNSGTNFPNDIPLDVDAFGEGNGVLSLMTQSTFPGLFTCAILIN